MRFVLSSKRTDLEALVCCAVAAKTCQPIGLTSQVTFLLPHHSVLPCTAATLHLCSPPGLADATVGSQGP